jgi:hypothetical protein
MKHGQQNFEKLYVGKKMTNFFAFKFLLHDKVSNVRKEAEIRG